MADKIVQPRELVGTEYVDLVMNKGKNAVANGNIYDNFRTLAFSFNKFLNPEVYASNDTNGLGYNANVTMANGILFSLGDRLRWSEDGKNWTNAITPTYYFTSLPIYANGLFVALAQTYFAWSEDGKNWTNGTTISSGMTYSQVIYANGVFVAGGKTDKTAWSSDGKTWTFSESIGSSSGYIYLAYGNGAFVAICSTGAWWSSDGKTWTRGEQASSLFGEITYVNNLFFILPSDEKAIWWSADGKTWTKATTPVSTALYSPIYANGLFVAGGSPEILWSSDGKTWTAGAGISPDPDLTVSTANTPIYANGLFVAGTTSFSKDSVWWSSDGKTWTKPITSLPDSIRGNPVFANGIFLIGTGGLGGAGAKLMWSVDASTWYECSNSETGFWSDPVYINGMVFSRGRSTTEDYTSLMYIPPSLDYGVDKLLNFD